MFVQLVEGPLKPLEAIGRQLLGKPLFGRCGERGEMGEREEEQEAERRRGGERIENKRQRRRFISFVVFLT